MKTWFPFTSSIHATQFLQNSIISPSFPSSLDLQVWRMYFELFLVWKLLHISDHRYQFFCHVNFLILWSSICYYIAQHSALWSSCADLHTCLLDFITQNIPILLASFATLLLTWFFRLHMSVWAPPPVSSQACQISPSAILPHTKLLIYCPLLCLVSV